MYGVGGERDLEEHELLHLHGYEGARPVRIGNGACQRQHDVWGAMLDSVYLHTRSRDRLDEAIWPILVKQVEQAIAHWQEPDRGMWEVRGEPKHFTSSKVMCWVACDRGARLARLREDNEQAERWQAVADDIKADVLAHGWTGAAFTAALRRRRAGRVAAAAPTGALPAARGRADRQDACPRHRRRADRGRPGAALPHGRDR